eukprot:5638374-Pyramimonas_sp.AAC.1
MRRNAGGTLAWHSKLEAEARLPDSESICQQHEMNCRLLETGSCYDQVNCSELAAFELICRQIQLIEERHYEDAVSAQASITSERLLAAEADHYMGASASKGNLCIAPALIEFIAEQLKAEAAIAKERRDAREERAARA